MYQAGDYIVYGTSGVCRVDEVKPSPFEDEADRQYYTLTPVTGTETIYIPVDSPVFTRPVISKEKAEELVREIPNIDVDHFKSHSMRLSSEHYQEVLQSHDCGDLVQLIKTVYAKSRRSGRRLSQVDQRYRKRAEELLDLVGLSQDSMRKFPHEFSGGQRQRLCIARALSVSPKLIVCDECVSALDVSIQAQIINLLMHLQQKLGIALVFVSHDLRVVQHISTHVAVMYLGKVVEYAEKQELFAHPTHPYTQALLSAVPLPDPTRQPERIILQGDLPSPIAVPSGCPFHPRCFAAMAECASAVPEARDITQNGHICSCLLCGQSQS